MIDPAATPDDPGPWPGDEPAYRLWRLWRDGGRPDAVALLREAGPVDAARVASALRVDQRERWRLGERVGVDAYLRDFPELAGDDELAFELIYGEYLLREERGERPSAEEYGRAFPRHAARLRLQLEVHRALAPGLGRDDAGGSTRASSTRLGRPGGGGAAGAPRPLPAVPGYEVVRELGRGGMGIVYEARQVRLNRPCALKMILAGDLAGSKAVVRFLAEAEAAARLRHPNIIQVYSTGDHDGRPYLEMEYAEGGSLADRLDGTPWPARDAARLAETLARTIHESHRRGVVHRDLKPANVLLAADGTPKVADFGLAKALGADAGLTATGEVVGTASYMAPEQAWGRAGEVGPAADIYALGAVLYELLTGRPPFRAATVLETLEQVRSAEPVPPSRLQPGLPRDLDTICRKCLEKAPTARYPSAEALAEDLGRFGDGRAIVARDSNVVERLVGLLQRGRHDQDFEAWGQLFLLLLPVFLAPHLLVFAAVLRAPELVRWANTGAWLLILLTAGLLFAVNRSRLRLPSSPAVRHIGSLWVALIVAATLMGVVGRMLRITAGPLGDLKLYPFESLLAGVLFFSLGGGYWGGCYLLGTAFFVAALVMPADLTWAPLEFAALMGLAFGAIGLHLRRLGRDAAGGRG